MSLMMPGLMCAGMPIIESALMTKMIPDGPLRKHRKKRIQKKWIKRYGLAYKWAPDDKVIIVKKENGQEVLVGHPKIIEALIQEIERKKIDSVKQKTIIASCKKRIHQIQQLQQRYYGDGFIGGCGIIRTDIA